MELLTPTLRLTLCNYNQKLHISFRLQEARRIKLFKNYPDVVSVTQLQEMLCIGKNTAYTLLKNNVIQSVRIGRIHKIPKKNIIKYLQEKA